MNRHDRRAQQSIARRARRHAATAGSSWSTTRTGRATRRAATASKTLQAPRFTEGQSIAGKVILSAYQTLENDSPGFSYLFRAETDEELSSAKTFKITEGIIQALHLDQTLINIDCFSVPEANLVSSGY